MYVSLYKGLMGVAGAMLAGERDFVDHARVWRDRLGGNVDRAWPEALAAERGLAELLPRMAEFADRARKLAAVLARLSGVRVVPDPPHTNMFHLHLDAPPDALNSAAQRLRERGAVMPPRYIAPLPSPRQSGVEITVSEQLDEVTDAEIGDLIAELISAARDQSSSDSSGVAAGGSTSPRIA